MVAPRLSMQDTDTPEKVLEAIKARNEGYVKKVMDKVRETNRQDEFTTWAMHDGDWDTGEHSLLHWACDTLKLEELAMLEHREPPKPSLLIVEALVETGISPNSRGQCNDTPLALISKSNHSEAKDIIDYLTKKGADPNARNEFGYTPLHEAVDHGSLLAVKRLMDMGANAQILNGVHKSAMELAKQNCSKGHKYQEILRCLEEAASEKGNLSTHFHGFFYSGNWTSPPEPLKRMQVNHMLQSSELKKKMSYQTRWFHLPANNVRAGSPPRT